MSNDFEKKSEKLKDMSVLQLIARCQKVPDGHLAWSELFKRFYALVATAAYRFVSQEADAEDVIQEVMVRFFNAIRRGLSFKTVPETEAFLWKVIKCVRANYFNSRRRATRVTYLELSDLEKLANTLRLADINEGADILIVLEEYIARTFANIEPDLRKRLEAKLMKGHSLTSIQAEFFPERSEGSVKQKLYREIRSFKALFADEINKDLSDSKLALAEKRVLGEIQRRLGGR